jgi:hypothetical protein
MDTQVNYKNKKIKKRKKRRAYLEIIVSVKALGANRT